MAGLKAKRGAREVLYEVVWQGAGEAGVLSVVDEAELVAKVRAMRTLGRTAEGVRIERQVLVID